MVSPARSRALAAASVALALLAAAPALAVARFGTAEVVLRADRSYSGTSGTPNPFIDVQLTLQVTSPTGKAYTVDGFFDGDGAGGAVGNVFKARVFTDQVGTWTWRSTSNNAGLNGKSGSLSCSGTLAGRFGAGPVVENPSRPRTFRLQAGGSIYLIGKFLDLAAPDPIKYTHTLFSELLTETNRQAMLDRHLGMKLNKINVYLANKSDYNNVSTTPWVGTAASNDRKRFDLARWRTYERWVVKMRDAGMVAHLWFFADGSGFGDLPEADRKLLIRYGMARLSAYANTFFTLMLEWQEGWTATEVDTHANYFHQQNPWARQLSVLGLPGDFSFPNAAWADFMDLQVGLSVTPTQVHDAGLRNRALAVKPLLNEEYSNGTESTSHRQKAWAAFVAGAAGSGTGAFLQHLATFVPQVGFERMDPADSLVLSGTAWCLAEKGRAYVLYLPGGGSVSVDLRAHAGTLTARWYDPRTGVFSSAGTTGGGAARSFTAPSTADWVLYLRP